MYGAQKELESVELSSHYFSVEFDAEYITSISISKIELEIETTFQFEKNKRITQSAYATAAILRISKEANKPTPDPEEHATWFDKLTDRGTSVYNDIEKITLFYSDGTKDIFKIPFDDGYDTSLEKPNVNLKTRTLSEGELVISVELKRSREECLKALLGAY